MMMPFAMNDFRKIGIGLTTFGLGFTFLGILLFFDKGLLAMGNVLFLAGVTLIIGAQRSVRFFFQKKKFKGSSFFFGGMVLVLIGFPLIGMGLEIFGFINLFGDFFPVAISFMRRMPIIGNILAIPGIKHVADKIAGAGKLPV